MNAARFLLLALFLAAIHAPFVFLASVDHDALALVAEIRATGRLSGWPGGFFFPGWAACLARVALLPFGAARGDWLLAYKLAAVACSIGSALCAYALVLALTRRVPLAVFSSLLLATLPGSTALLAVAEDNLIPAFMNALHLCAFIALVAAWKTPSGHSLRARLAISAFYPVSLALAVLSHRQMAVVWIAPLLLWPLLRGAPRARIVAAAYAAAGAIFLLAFAWLAVAWNGALSWKSFADSLEWWFLPGGFYRRFYFFNAFGWDLPRQAGEIIAGARTIYAPQGFGQLAETLYGGALLALLIALRSRHEPARRAAWPVAAISILTAVHVPHSLVYESANLERWDVLMFPGVILAALAADAALETGVASRRLLRGGFAVAGLLLAFNAAACSLRLRDLIVARAKPENRAKARLIEESFLPGPPPILLMSVDEFREIYPTLACYYSYRDSIFALGPGALAFRPALPYSVPPREIPRDELRLSSAGRRLVLTDSARRLLGLDASSPIDAAR